MVDLGDVDPAEQRRVIDEFLRVEPMVPGKDAGRDRDQERVRSSGQERVGVQGQELPPSSSPLTRTLTARPPSALTPHPPLSPRHRPSTVPFRLLRDAEADKLARILDGERPQTIALVLSHLPPSRPAACSFAWRRGLQADVVRRLVDLEETEPEILREVEQALESRLSEHIHMQRRRVAGLSRGGGHPRGGRHSIPRPARGSSTTLPPLSADRHWPTSSARSRWSSTSWSGWTTPRWRRCWRRPTASCWSWPWSAPRRHWKSGCWTAPGRRSRLDSPGVEPTRPGPPERRRRGPPPHRRAGPPPGRRQERSVGQASPPRRLHAASCSPERPDDRAAARWNDAMME